MLELNHPKSPIYVASIVFEEKTIFFTLREVGFHSAMVLHELFSFHAVREVVICVTNRIDRPLAPGVKIFLCWFAQRFEHVGVTKACVDRNLYILNLLCAQCWARLDDVRTETYAICEQKPIQDPAQ